MTVRFCTLFDANYAARGLVMLQSLQAYRHRDDDICVLAIDEQAKQMVERASADGVRVVRPADLDDAELMAAEQSRPRREFCWTCAPALSAWMVRTANDGDTVIYLDADLLFFRDPRILLEELDGGGSILIHEHRYSPDRLAWEPTSGRFNVGFVAFKVGEEARACVSRWRAQTIEKCELDPDNGYCGDQGYLNEWPERYPNLRVMANIGGGVAPWNVNQYRVTKSGADLEVDKKGVVFFHYHALKTLADKANRFIGFQPAMGYDFAPAVLNEIYRPYAARLSQVMESLRLAGFPSRFDRVVEDAEFLHELRSGNCLDLPEAVSRWKRLRSRLRLLWSSAEHRIIRPVTRRMNWVG